MFSSTNTLTYKRIHTHTHMSHTHTHTHTHKLTIATLWKYPFVLTNKVLPQRQFLRQQCWRNKGHHCVLLFKYSYKVALASPHLHLHTHLHTHIHTHTHTHTHTHKLPQNTHKYAHFHNLHTIPQFAHIMFKIHTSTKDTHWQTDILTYTCITLIFILYWAFHVNPISKYCRCDSIRHEKYWIWVSVMLYFMIRY